MNTPNPGSIAAGKQGCTCAVIDNHYGAGFPYPDGEGGMQTSFYIDGGCPLHSTIQAMIDERKRRIEAVDSLVESIVIPWLDAREAR